MGSSSQVCSGREEHLSHTGSGTSFKFFQFFSALQCSFSMFPSAMSLSPLESLGPGKVAGTVYTQSDGALSAKCKTEAFLRGLQFGSGSEASWGHLGFHWAQRFASDAPQENIAQVTYLGSSWIGFEAIEADRRFGDLGPKQHYRNRSTLRSLLL